jgi:DMSO/TMAO reductase YedYZ heme-binding membrane subunit
VSGRRGSRRRRHISSVARATTPRRGLTIWIVIVFVVFVVFVGAAASGSTARGQDILAAVQHFMLFYSGVLALVALTAAVGVGILATDRIVMVPASRVVAQAVHRAVSLAAVAFLVTHIVLEILAHRSAVIDAFVPFLARGRTVYLGLGTVASDLVIVLIVTGIARGRFATRWPWTWRAIHATAYLAWPLSIVHGLLAGRTAKPYVDWSYGACLVAVGLALVIRLVATLRSSQEKAAYAVPDRASAPPVHAPAPIQPAMPIMPAMAPDRRYDPRGAMPGWQAGPRALPPGTSGGQGAAPQPPYPQGTPYLSARRYPAPHPDQPGHPSGPWQYQPPQQPEPGPGHPSGPWQYQPPQQPEPGPGHPSGPWQYQPPQQPEPGPGHPSGPWQYQPPQQPEPGPEPEPEAYPSYPGMEGS